MKIVQNTIAFTYYTSKILYINYKQNKTDPHHMLCVTQKIQLSPVTRIHPSIIPSYPIEVRAITARQVRIDRRVMTVVCQYLTTAGAYFQPCFRVAGGGAAVAACVGLVDAVGSGAAIGGGLGSDSRIA